VIPAAIHSTGVRVQHNQGTSRTSRIFVISSPSGGGKTTLTRRLIRDKDLAIVQSISATTRPPRPDEKNGIDYHFLTPGEFQRRRKRRAFLEWEKNFGHCYGTPKRFIQETLAAGRHVLLSIDVKGAMKVQRRYPSRSVLIFVKPPSLVSLKKRLQRRHTDRSGDIKRRLREARRELSYRGRYDYQIVNDRLEKAYERLKTVIYRETHR